jgi:hypothetical protein
MDDRVPGTDPPIAESRNVMNALSSPAEQRAFRRFVSELNKSADCPIEPERAVDVWLRDYAERWRRRRALTAAQLQAEEIRKHRWIESEKSDCDMGKQAHVEWVTQHAAAWRDWFEQHYDGPLADCD